MKSKVPVLFLFLFFVIPSILAQNKFYLDLTNRDNDIFTVTLIPEKLSDENGIFQFASIAPGTYQKMDLGRFVRSFVAYDENENEIETKQESLNQWSISSPAKVKKIVYQIEDTWDTPVDSNKIYLMCGSSIEMDNVLINGQCVFGYFHGMQSEPINVKIDYPYEWVPGTALQLNEEGYYEAESYDHIVDSPILLGELSKASTTISDTKVDIYTYSKTGLIKSSDILVSIEDILKAQAAFTNGLPVDHYTFLFQFGDVSQGAWEHSYSSGYVFKEDSLSEQFIQSLNATVAHEFFHIVTPLNIHSELVEEFNFVKPELSQHLWLYEGVTEWAAHILQLRDSLISLREYLDVLQQKLKLTELFDPNISLTHLGVNSTEMQNQYPNIYLKGATVAGLLDIRLLELSNGKKGLREIINELSKKFGPDNAFNEKTFFDDFTTITYPEIKDFFNKYIINAEPLPVKDYYEKIGINYFEESGYDSSKISLGIQIGFNGSEFLVEKVTDESPNMNILKPGDIIHKVNEEQVTIENARKIFEQVRKTHKVGDSIIMTVLRDDNPVDVELKFMAQKNQHVFSLNENATEDQIKLRNAWIRNM